MRHMLSHDPQLRLVALFAQVIPSNWHEPRLAIYLRRSNLSIRRQHGPKRFLTLACAAISIFVSSSVRQMCSLQRSVFSGLDNTYLLLQMGLY
eukprot:SAG31_NODE_4630_length_3085_cov_2.376758_3_plen_93_part_00